MNDLRQAMTEYLATRRALGFQLETAESCLRSFVTFMETQRASFVTTQLAVDWAKEPTHTDPAHWTRRLGIVRQFAAWRSAVDPRTQVPPNGILPHRFHRKPPHIYTDEEVARLMLAARALRC